MTHQREGRADRGTNQPRCGNLSEEDHLPVSANNVLSYSTVDETSAGPIGIHSQDSMNKVSYISKSMFTVTVSAKLSYNDSPELPNWSDPPHPLILLLFFMLTLTAVSLVHVVLRTGQCFYTRYFT
jgi:hypothetical protein